nr:MAG TPA: hypothetical protein [Caudoviricetes sp.]
MYPRFGVLRTWPGVFLYVDVRVGHEVHRVP